MNIRTNTNEELLKKIDDAPLLMATEAARKKLRKPRSVYGDQILFMLAALVMATYSYGVRAVVVAAVSVICCILTDMVGCFLSGKEYGAKDLSTVAYALAVALMLPASVEYYIVIIGAVLAIVVKHIFGGKDNYIFNPAAVAIAFLIICYPTQVLQFPAKGEMLPVFGENTAVLSGGIESSFIKNGAMPDLSVLDILMGNFAGPMGATHILVLAVSGICLIFRRSISLSATVCAMGSMAGLSCLLTDVEPLSDVIVFQFVSGFVLFGFIFLANDPQTLPLTGGGRILYGLALGMITAIFRSTANIEGVFVFSLLIVNALSLYLDRLVFDIGKGIKRIMTYLKNNLGTFERFSKDVKQGKTPSLTDTQEIMIEPVNFNMPPIDNKVTKVKRKKRTALREIVDNINKKQKNNKEEKKKAQSDAEKERGAAENGSDEKTEADGR